MANGKPVTSSLNVISLQIDVLSITMAAVGFALAVIGLFGYQSIKDVAMEHAERAADAIATKAVALHMENIRETSVAGLRGGDGPLPIEPEDVNPAEGGE